VRAVNAVAVGKKGLARIRAGHPWIYRSDLAPDPGPAIESGAVVRVNDPRGRAVGTAFYSGPSQIALRMLAHEALEVDAAFLRERLRRAIELRERLGLGRFVRLVNSDADGLPGLVVDRYGDHVVLQALVPGIERRKDLLCDLLEELLRPAGIVERSDVSSRAREELLPAKGVLRGTYQGPTILEEAEARIAVDLLAGQKTGSFLDQRENHLAAGGYARGDAADLFSYAGGFALQLARRAERTTAVEISAAACESIRENAVRSGVALDVVEANAFDWLRDRVAEGRRFDTLVLDPPAFAKSRSTVDAAIRGYKEINLRAFQLLAPGGVLFTCTCSFHVSVERFEETVLDAARDARREVQVLERRGAGRDHPVLLAAPETRYLKCLVLRTLS
jgi:23S rRNA (cytosine1962-C5)-methyltransferase